MTSSNNNEIINYLLIGSSLFLLYRWFNLRDIEKTSHEEWRYTLIPEDRLDIDNIDRLSRYQNHSQLKDSRVLTEMMKNKTVSNKLNTIVQINKEIKNSNFNHIINELARPDYQDSSNEQYRKKIFTEYTFQ
jgi:hypothetical protein